MVVFCQSVLLKRDDNNDRTQERIVASFWWPGMSGDITRFCHSCDVCQRTISMGRVPKVPLGKMPVIETSFKRVAVDLIGEMFPLLAVDTNIS